jgi:hypothetical protein
LPKNQKCRSPPYSSRGWPGVGPPRREAARCCRAERRVTKVKGDGADCRRSGPGRTRPLDMGAYFGFFGPRFFGLGPDRPDGSASSPRHGQESLNASKARVMPATSNRSGFRSRYRNRTLALSKMLPCPGGHARTSAGRFGEKNMAVSIIPSHAPADRASRLSRNEPSTSSSQYFCASAPVSTTVPLAFPMTESARLAAMI